MQSEDQEEEAMDLQAISITMVRMDVHLIQSGIASKPLRTPIPDGWYPPLPLLLLLIGLVVTTSFLI